VELRAVVVEWPVRADAKSRTWLQGAAVVEWQSVKRTTHMQLDAEEIAKLRRGERLEVDVPEVGARCVVLRSEAFAKLLGSAGEDLPPEVVSDLVDRAMAEDDAGDPLLAGYQTCRR
jgi:hypothetical protein